MGLVFLCLLASALAHNWINSPSRSEFANTVKPSLPSATGEPHVKVIANQRFQIEWVVGHDSDCYFVLLSEDNHLNNMLKHDTKMFEDYINNAPANQKVSPDHPWMKYHRKVAASTENTDNKRTGDKFFQQSIKPGEKWFVTRPAVFEGRFTGARSSRGINLDHSKLRQMVYKKGSSCVATDRRVMYKSAKYPWVIGIHKYKLCADQPNRPDFANIAFPTGTKPGKYMVHWSWRGYYDVIDVEVVAGTKPVAKPYGDKRAPPPPGTRSSYRRVDHCLFPDATPVNRCNRIRTNTEACLMACDRLNQLQCEGVNVVPVINPPTVYKAFKNQNFIPYKFTRECNKGQIERGATVNDRVCFPLKARAKTDVIDSYIVSDDSDDPVFYSTCFIRLKPSSFSGPSKAPPRVPAWQFRANCVTCKEAQLSTVEHYIPRWPLSNKCAHCVNDGPKLSTFTKPVDHNKTTPWRSIEPNGYCLGIFGASDSPNYKCTDNRRNCKQTLYLPSGNGGDVSDQDCIAMAKANPKCSNVVFKRAWPNAGNPTACWCWDKEPCCGACSVRKTNGYKMFKI